MLVTYGAGSRPRLVLRPERPQSTFPGLYGRSFGAFLRNSTRLNSTPRAPQSARRVRFPGCAVDLSGRSSEAVPVYTVLRGLPKAPAE